VALGTQGWVAGEVVLKAGGNIGIAAPDATNPDVVVSDYALAGCRYRRRRQSRAGLSATTTNGVINVSEMSGSLAVISVSAGGNQSVFLTTRPTSSRR